jgi:hypothetical protein
MSRNEIDHGSSLWADLAADPGPAPGVDLYRLGQDPYASYEVVVDGLSADLVPGLSLERLAADNVTVLQSAAPIGAGPNLSLRFENVVPAEVHGQHIRVRNPACGSTCGAQAVYRLRAYETTYAVPRFNDSGGQVTFLILQNPTSAPIAGRVHFWNGVGALLLSHPFSVAERATFVLNTASLPALQGQSGSITVSNDGRYGELMGKAVAVESATGFTFDSTLAPKRR